MAPYRFAASGRGAVLSQGGRCKGGICVHLILLAIVGTRAAHCPNNCWGNGECHHAGFCICHSGFRGTSCERAPPSICSSGCSGHGICRGRGNCTCFDGFTGPDCSQVAEVSPCPSACSGHGHCSLHGRCDCDEGFGGPACGAVTAPIAACPDACSGHGRCDPRSGCHCDAGFSGPSCSKLSVVAARGHAARYSAAAPCPDNCSGKGRCVPETGRCQCESGFAGAACNIAALSVASCPHNCSGHGSCEFSSAAEGGGDGHRFGGMGRCVCGSELHHSWSGVGCESLAAVEGCPYGCSAHGVCEPLRGSPGHGRCVCRDGFSGKACDRELRCPARCNLRGNCIDGKCHCGVGWQGPACDVPRCEGGCSGHGECLPPIGEGSAGACLCAGGWAGVACDEWRPYCPNACSGHGECRGGRCVCDEGYIGPGCGELLGSAPATSIAAAIGDRSCGAVMCNRRGLCRKGRAEGSILCECFDGHGGPSCERSAPPRRARDAVGHQAAGVRL